MEVNSMNILKLSILCLCTLVLVACKPVVTEDPPGDVLQPLPAQANWVTRHGLTSSQYQTEFDKWTDKDYRLTYVSGHQQQSSTGGLEARYNAIWEKTSGANWYAKHDMSAAEYQTAVDEADRRGYQPILVDAFNVGSNVLFVAIFEEENSDWVARHGMTSSDYQAVADDLVENKGYRIRHVSGYEVRGQAYYAAIFDKSDAPDWGARHDMTSSEYQQAFDDFADIGMAPVVIDGFFVGTTEYFTAIWQKADTRFGARHQITGGSDYQNVADDFYFEGYRPVAVDSYSDDGTSVLYATAWKNMSWYLDELDEINNMVETFRTANGIPSLSLAIVKDEKLVYAKAFGQADMEANEAATTNHRYRIASLSKALTGAAVSKVLEDSTLSLTDQVFGTNGVLSSYGLDNVLADSDITSIQVQDLLEHTSGGWGANCSANTPDEPIMFSNNQQSRDWLITNTITNVPLPGTPGSSFCYSNFGFAALEAVIEANNGGTDYITYVLNELADPSGATSLAVAGNTLADRAFNEVKYYDFFNPYVWNVSRMVAHGGWMVTPVDYLRIMTKLDGGSYRTDLLGATGIDIYTRDDVVVGNDAWNISNGFYGKGLVRNNGQSRWDHNGNITGTLAEYLRYDDGWSAMLVINMRQPPSGNSNTPRPALKQLAIDIHDANIYYPDHDLF
jgi:CubicO group peptidase (beta-lactamase class C family)